jgi:hypothetical protein
MLMEMDAPPQPREALSRWRQASAGNRRWVYLETYALGCWCIALIGSGAIVIHGDQSVLLFGPLLAAAASIELLWGLRRKYRGIQLLAALHLCVCSLFVALVLLLSWSPSYAQRPFSFMSTAYTALTAAATVWVLRHPPIIHQPGSCDACGYLLHGLITPRCPECGLPFDPRELTSGGE